MNDIPDDLGIINDRLKSVSDKSRIMPYGSHEDKNDLTCCCQNKDCAHRLETEALLDELYGNLSAAGELGQALLVRHEQAVAEAEKEKLRMTSLVMSLERRTQELEEENTVTIESNRALLNQLEELNHSVTQADAQVRDLTSDLDHTKAELDRVAARSARVDFLEAQLDQLETEANELRHTLFTTQEEEKMAVAKWQKLERLSSELTEQLNKIEMDYMEEKLRNQKMMSKFEQRKLNREQSLPTSNSEKVAVSRFMKEILADNAQLQAGTSELRHLLEIAQNEIGALREGMLHQRLDSPSNDMTPLSQEIGLSTSKVSQELHVHHHHHHVTKVDSMRKKPKKQRSKNKEGMMKPGMVSEYDSSVPVTPKRWSAQSSAFSAHTRSSSVPSPNIPETPSTTFRESSIFDRPYNVEDSRPTSAGSDTPNLGVADYSGFQDIKTKHHKRQPSNFSARSVPDVSDYFQSASVAETPIEEETESLSIPAHAGFTPQEEEEELDYTLPDQSNETPGLSAPYLATTIPGRKLIRSASVESLLAPETTPITFDSLVHISLSKVAPGSLTSTSTTMASPQAILTSATARQAPVRYGSSTYNRLLLSQAASAKTPPTKPIRSQSANAKGWFWNRFGSSGNVKTVPNASSSLSRHVSSSDVVRKSSAASADVCASPVSNSDRSRTPSIQSTQSFDNTGNGLRASPIIGPGKAQPTIQATTVDEDSLRESLAE